MALSKKLIALFLLISVSILAFAMTKHKVTYSHSLPSYKDILDAQFRCDKKMFNKFKWNPSLNVKLATKTLSIISDLNVKELDPQKYQKKYGSNRSFEISFRGIAYFECGRPVLGLDEEYGRQLLIHETICHSHKNPEYIDGIDEDPPGSYVEGWPNFISNITSTDIEPPPDTRGNVCLVTLDNFLDNPRAIDLNKLCAGESKEKRELTKKEIAKTIEILKKRQANKQKKSSHK